ncbi:MAG: hypothetical protein IJ675_02285, partial [Pseudobutyrivibrio sp.]|nr:hypothetical protein [Pseudobutyrivibrio sp.]
FSGKPVLVVFTKGDKAGTSKLYKEESQHFDIISARTDKEALSYISQYHNNISIIFLEMDAIDDCEMVLRYIKTREGFANIPVLAVASSEENGKRAKELGADEVLLENSPDALYKKTVHKLIGM